MLDVMRYDLCESVLANQITIEQAAQCYTVPVEQFQCVCQELLGLKPRSLSPLEDQSESDNVSLD